LSDGAGGERATAGEDEDVVLRDGQVGDGGNVAGGGVVVRRGPGVGEPEAGVAGRDGAEVVAKAVGEVGDGQVEDGLSLWVGGEEVVGVLAVIELDRDIRARRGGAGDHCGGEDGRESSETANGTAGRHHTHTLDSSRRRRSRAAAG